MANIKQLVGVAAGLLTIAVFFMLAPMIGGTMDTVSENIITQEATATGTLTFSGNVTDGELVNITSGVTTYTLEFNDGAASKTSYINVNYSGGLNTSTTAPGILVTAINGNASLAAIVTATNGTTTVIITADTSGAAGNSIATTETGAQTAFAAATLSGGADGSDWDPDHNSAMPTGADFWTDNAALITIVVIAILAGIVIREFVMIERS